MQGPTVVVSIMMLIHDRKQEQVGDTICSTVIPRLVRSLRVRILGTRSIEDVQNDSQCAF